MIDHVSIPVRDLKKAADFYEKVLAPLGMTKLVDGPATVGFGKRYPEFWLNARPEGGPAPENTGCHICLRTRTEDAVSSFHDIAVENGGRTDGAPGPRQAAMTPYFGAFILDPDGNKIEAVCFPAA